LLTEFCPHLLCGALWAEGFLSEARPSRGARRWKALEVGGKAVGG
jgi:hypothetical protein